MMEFLQPSLLWGTLAVAIPIAIHFWHQKKGKVLAWAATQWLLEKSQQSQRGLRLDQLLLLALRCLIMIILALMLSEPFFRIKPASATRQKVHLVQPDAFVVDNYRFELEEAQQQGEAIYWIAPTPRRAGELSVSPTDAEAMSPVLLQTAINQLTRDEVALHLYIKNSRGLSQIPQVQTPIDFQLHAASDSLNRPIRPYRLVTNNQKLYINADNRLRVGNQDPDITFASEPVGAGPLPIRIDVKNPDERKTVEAALRAFAEVYGLELTIDATANVYIALVTDRVPALVRPATLYVVTGQVGKSVFPNVVYTSDTLTPQASPMVASGQLPEWLGEQILNHIGLAGASAPLTQAELTTLFKPTKPTSGASSVGTQRIFFIILLVLVTLERGLALIKNA